MKRFLSMVGIIVAILTVASITVAAQSAKLTEVEIWEGGSVSEAGPPPEEQTEQESTALCAAVWSRGWIVV